MSAWVLVLYLNSSGSALLAIDMPNRALCEEAGQSYKVKYNGFAFYASYICLRRANDKP